MFFLILLPDRTPEQNLKHRIDCRMKMSNSSKDSGKDEGEERKIKCQIECQQDVTGMGTSEIIPNQETHVRSIWITR